MILVLNLKKRGRNRQVRSQVENMIHEHSVDLIFLQEAQSPRTSSEISFSGMEVVTSSTDLCVFARNGTENTIKVVLSTPFAVTVLVGRTAFTNVHLSPYSSSERTQQLEILREQLSNIFEDRHFVTGDFNLAPRSQDGMSNGRPSTWSGAKERKALASLMSALDLEDVLAKSPPEYTIVREIGGNKITFRCDLLLAPASETSKLSAKYIHSTRTGPLSFTDHSGILADVRL